MQAASYLGLFICLLWNTSNLTFLEYQNVTRSVKNIETDSKSLVFVFDVTGSMSAELNQVKRGASSILKNFTSSSQRIIDKFIFAPFNDPVVGPIWSTTSVTDFESKIQNVHVDGGGDCPELSLTALKEGTELTSIKSHIFVFTDAHPKDTNLLVDVISLIRQKECQVTFLLTGSCKDDEFPSEFQKIASISSGQVFNLLKTDIFEVLKAIHASIIQRNQVNLLTVDITAESESSSLFRIHQFFVDETVTEILISISGDTSSFEILPPRFEKEMKSFWILKLNTVKLLKFENPVPGLWNVAVKSFKSYSVRTSGNSILNFVYGFSIQFTSNINETIHIPFKEVTNYFLLHLNTKDFTNMSTCDFVAFDGTSLAEIPLYAVENSTNLFYGLFKPNNENFRMQVTGVTKNGHVFKRLTVPSLQSNDLALLIYVPEKVVLNVDSNYSLGCKIESAQLFEAQWRKHGSNVFFKKSFNESGTFIQEFSKVSLNDTGIYSCYVIRKKDTQFKSTYVQIVDKPRCENLPLIVKLDLLADYLLPCSTTGYPEPNITWVFNNETDINNSRPISLVGDNVFEMPNGTLLLTNILANQSGNYSCLAENEAGKDRKSVQIFVRGDVNNNQSSVDVMKIIESQKAVFDCPSHQDVHWKKGNNTLNMKINERADEPHFILSKRGNKLKITEVDATDGGDYSCTFRNTNGLQEHHFKLQILIPLTFRNEYYVESDISLNEGDSVVLDCSADGLPIPTVTYWKEGFNFPITKWTLANVTFNVNKQSLRIWPVNRTLHLGIYQCVLKNEISILRKVFRLV